MNDKCLFLEEKKRKNRVSKLPTLLGSAFLFLFEKI